MRLMRGRQDATGTARSDEEGIESFWYLLEVSPAPRPSLRDGSRSTGINLGDIVERVGAAQRSDMRSEGSTSRIRIASNPS
jgi:hypothetical protein